MHPLQKAKVSGVVEEADQEPTAAGAIAASSIRRRLGWLLLLLLLLGILTGFVVEDGDLSSIDAARRWQVTQSLWTGAPEVLKDDYPAFGVVGRDGVIRAWYGVGQSLVMLPADLLGSLVVGEVAPPPASSLSDLSKLVESGDGRTIRSG